MKDTYRKVSKFIIVMVKEVIDFYWYIMDLHSKITNMIVYHLDYGIHKFKNRLDNYYFLEIWQKKIEFRKYIKDLVNINIKI